MRREIENIIKRADNGDRLAGYFIICLDGETNDQCAQRHHINPVMAKLMLKAALHSVDEELKSESDEAKDAQKIVAFAMAEGKEIKDQESLDEVVKDIRSKQDETK